MAWAGTVPFKIQTSAMLSFDAEPIDNMVRHENTYHICNFLDHQLAGDHPMGESEMQHCLERRLCMGHDRVQFQCPLKFFTAPAGPEWAEAGDFILVIALGNEIEWAGFVVR